MGRASRTETVTGIRERLIPLPLQHLQHRLLDESIKRRRDGQRELHKCSASIWVGLRSALLRGSLIERYKRCGKPGCKCADGPGHGPKYYLSVSFPGRRPQMDYVPQADYADVTQRLANHHRVREIIEEICEINRELLRRREAF
jgi:hypothetical protein